MGQMKEHDWFVETLGNPNFTNSDFKGVGIDITNTSIATEDVYANSPQIQSLPLFLTNGTFDKAKLHNHYIESVTSYNKLAEDTYEDDLKKHNKIFHRDDIFVSPDERREQYDTTLQVGPNPDLTTFGIVRLNLPGKRTKTPMELAESNFIFDPDTGKFTEDTPENSFFKNFFKPIVMATWEFDADLNGNPTSDPNAIVYHLGEYKLDDNGNYYSEFLNGRSNYGKQLISKFNILTPEDSKLNSIDFFDSDDIKKSTTGSLIRNALEIIPLYIPYVGATYMATSIALNTTQALATLGKLFVGSDNKTLNTIEAFGLSFDKTVSEEGQQHMFSIENILNMVGETFVFLKTQRMIAEQAPRIFKGKIPKNDDEAKAMVLKKSQEFINNNVTAAIKAGTTPIYNDILGFAPEYGKMVVNNQIRAYLKLGQLISKNYMAITFGLHTYGIAKSQNVSDEVATMLTLGAIAGQYAILNSHIGSHIFPESLIEGQQLKLSALALGKTKLPLDLEQTAIEQTADKVEKLNFFEEIFKKGKELAGQIYESPMPTATRATITSSLATGIEMTTFLVLDDVIASVYNLGAWLSGEDNRMSAWDNVLERYANSFLGGAVAGAINAPEIYKASKGLVKMDSEKALLYITALISEGKELKFLDAVDKIDDFGNQYLSARNKLTIEDSELNWALGDAIDNLNLAIKQLLHNLVSFIKTVLESHNAKLSETAILDTKLRKSIKLSSLSNSVAVSEYLLNFHNLLVDIVRQVMKIESATDLTKRQARDSEANKGTEKKDLEIKNKTAGSDKQEAVSLNALQLLIERQKLANLIKRKDEFLSGKMAAPYVKLALFELSYGINSAYLSANKYIWVETNKGKKWSDLTELEKIKYDKEYKQYIENHKALVLHEAFKLFEPTNKIISDTIRKEKLDKFNTETPEIISLIKTKNKILLDIVDRFTGESLVNISTNLEDKTITDLISSLYDKYTSEEEKKYIDFLRNKKNELATLFPDENIRKFMEEEYNQLLKQTNVLWLDKFINDLSSEIENYTLDYDSKRLLDSVITKLSSQINELIEADAITKIDHPIKDDETYDLLEVSDPSMAKTIESVYNKIISKLYMVLDENLGTLQEKIANLDSPEIIKAITETAKTFTLDGFDFMKLLLSLNKQFKLGQSDPSKFFVDLQTYDNIVKALTILDMFRNGIVAANDVVDSLLNLYGYNVTVNDLTDSDLVTIKPEITAQLLTYIEPLETKLTYYKHLIEAAKGLKLVEQARIDVHTKFLFYKRLSEKFKFIPKSWVGVEEFTNKLNNLRVLKEYSTAGSTSLNSEENKLLSLDTIKFEQLIYDFFNKNIENVKDPVKLAEFLKAFKLDTIEESKGINGTDNFNDDHGLIWYIAGITAFSPDKFYSNYQKSISERIAPTYTLTIHNYFAIAMRYGNEVIEYFKKGIQQTLKDVTKDDLVNMTSNYPYFSNICLIEADPGAGKSFGIIPQIVAFYEQADPNKLKNIWVASTSKKDSPDVSEAALRLRKECRLNDNENALSKKKLMLRISSEWHEELSDDGLLIVKESDVTVNHDTGDIEYNFKLKEISSSEKPELIIIDEISDYSELDLKLIDKWAIKNNVIVITAGDFSQSGLYGNFNLTVKGKKIDDYVLELNRHLIKGLPKLSISFRTENNQQDINLATAKVRFEELKKPSEDWDINLKDVIFHYYEDSGLYGTRIMYKNSNNLSSHKAAIDKLFADLGENEKIGFVYDSEDSEIYKYIMGKYKDKVNPLKGNTAKGLEGRYYIVDLNSLLSDKKDNTQKIRDLYTVITRSKLGNLLLLPRNFTSNNQVRFVNTKDSSTTKVELSQESILKQSELTKSILAELFPEPISLTKAKKSSSGGSGTGGSSGSETESKIKLIDDIKNRLKTDGFDEQDKFLDDLEALIDDGLTYEEAVALEDKILATLSVDGELDGVKFSKELKERAGTLRSKYVPILNAGPPSVDGEEPPRKKDPAEPPKEDDVIPPVDFEISEHEQATKKAVLNKESLPSLVPSKNEHIREPIRVRFPKISNDDESVTIDGVIAEVFNLGLYTFPNNYTGLSLDSSGNYVLSFNSEARLDNYYGLLHILNLLGDAGNKRFKLYGDGKAANQVSLKVLLEIRNMIYTEKDRSKLLADIINLLITALANGNRDAFNNKFSNFYLRWGWNSNYSQNTEHNGNSPIRNDIHSRDHKAEKTYGSLGTSERSLEPSPKGFELIIGANVDGEDLILLTVPFAKFPNLDTILERIGEDKDLKMLKLKYDELKAANDGYTARKLFYKYLIELTKLEVEPGRTGLIFGAASLALLLRIYLYNLEGLCYLDGFGTEGGYSDDWTFAQLFDSTGPFMILNDRGYNYEVKGFEHNEDALLNTTTLLSLEDLGIFSISSIYMNGSVNENGTRKNLVDSAGNTVLNSGDAFVLVGLGDEFNGSDNSLFEYYQKQLSDAKLPIKVKRFYVSEPRATIEEFLDKIVGKYDKQYRVEKEIGNELTSFRILAALHDKKGDEFWNDVASVVELKSHISKVKQFIIDHKSDSSENLLKAIRSSEFGKKTKDGTPLSSRTFIERFLFRYLQPASLYLRENSTFDYSTRKGKVIGWLKETFPDGIPYNIFWGKRTADYLLSLNGVSVNIYQIVTDKDFKYELYGKPFKIHTITTPLLVGDAFFLLRYLNQKLLDSSRPSKGNRLPVYYQHTESYRKGDARIRHKKENNIVKGIIKDKKVAKLIKSGDTEKTIILKMHQNGYPTLKIDDKIIVFTQVPEKKKIKTFEKTPSGFVLEYEDGSIIKGEIRQEGEEEWILMPNEYENVDKSLWMKPASEEPITVELINAFKKFSESTEDDDLKVKNFEDVKSIIQNYDLEELENTLTRLIDEGSITNEEKVIIMTLLNGYKGWDNNINDTDSRLMSSPYTDKFGLVDMLNNISSDINLDVTNLTLGEIYDALQRTNILSRMDEIEEGPIKDELTDIKKNIEQLKDSRKELCAIPIRM